ncbi:hypothetical protein [Sphingosinicella sp. CPCC 101087]|uniref:DUF6894 family protein n=1 Tax=Sphingosinicella sp. CPCC 101087 TaxID=2497754 RepID=UPI00101C4895|nr:hypothetical protein [Sphingosinicella sp. CPCC 101087]
MPRYYFHLHNDMDVSDEEGMGLPDLEAAREQALENARVMACVSIKEQGNVNLDHYIEVTDERGEALFKLTFREAFTVTG